MTEVTIIDGQGGDETAVPPEQNTAVDVEEIRAAVDLARIEADKEVALANIDADTKVREQMAEIIQHENEEKEQWTILQDQVSALTETVTTLRDQISTLLTPPPPLQETEIQAEIQAEIPADQIPEEYPESAEESPAQQTPKRRTIKI